MLQKAWDLPSGFFHHLQVHRGGFLELKVACQPGIQAPAFKLQFTIENVFSLLCPVYSDLIHVHFDLDCTSARVCFLCSIGKTPFEDVFPIEHGDFPLPY